MQELQNEIKNLKYLFEVEYVDGTKFKQPADDKSRMIDSSAFYDVLHSGKEIAVFSLKSVENSDYTSVDLRTGEFEVNGAKVYTDSPPCLKRELIFFRQHQHDTQVNYYLKNGEIKDHKPTAHRIRYFLGWQADIKGKNYQQKVGVD